MWGGKYAFYDAGLDEFKAANTFKTQYGHYGCALCEYVNRKLWNVQVHIENKHAPLSLKQ